MIIKLILRNDISRRVFSVNRLVVLGLFGVVCAVSACAEGNLQNMQIYQVTVQAAADDPVYVVPALTATAQQFVGARSTRSTSNGTARAGPSFGLPSIPPDLLSPDSTTRRVLDHSQRRAVTAAMLSPVRGAVALRTAVGVGQGASRYGLPDGLGILDDPTRIDFDTQYFTVETGLVWDHLISPQLGVELGLGAGKRWTRTQTKITSALLNVQNTSYQNDGFLALRGGVYAAANHTAKGRVQLDLEILAYPGTAVTVGGVISAKY
jgi:hypothetical protein